MSAASDLVIFVNGKKVIEKNADPETSLITYLRTTLNLTSVKLGCNEGGCGSCTVMVSNYNRHTERISHFTANACLAPLCSMHGMAITTAEGIGNTKTKLHPVQERIAECHGTQCGFCTPGFVMSMYTLLRNNPSPSIREVEAAFDGNLCRCTGYRPILEGFKTFCQESGCCRNNGLGSDGDDAACDQPTPKLYESREFSLYDPSQDVIFPPELLLDAKKSKEKMVRFKGERVEWIKPTTLEELLELKGRYPEAKLVVGNTEIGIETKFKNMVYPIIIAATGVAELKRIEHNETGIVFGASCTLACVEEVLKEQINHLEGWKTGVFSAVVEMLRWFAGHQIRNVASIGGNIVTGSPISDLNPLFMASGSILTLASLEGGVRKIVMDDSFFTGYRKTRLKPDEILLSVHLPHTKKNEHFLGYKQSPRREDDIAIVNAGMRVIFVENSDIISELSLSFGGMAPTTVMAKKTMNSLVGRHWDEEMLSVACALLAEDLPLTPGSPGGMEHYRRTLTTSFFFKFYLSVLNKLENMANTSLREAYRSAIASRHRGPTSGTQVYQAVSDSQHIFDKVGRPVAIEQAKKATSGEAIYYDDIPTEKRELYAGIVFSKYAHAIIRSVDKSEAIKLDGVHSYIGYEDVPTTGSNLTGVVAIDEEIFATSKVTCVGQVIGLILADTQLLAQKAAKLVRVEYEVLEPIFTIEDAVRKESFFLSAPLSPVLEKGSIEQGFADSDQVIEGEMKIGSQEHFYLETQVCRCVPSEDGAMEVYCSTQNPTFVQGRVARALGISANKVNCRVKRLGGGFGGKITRCNMLALPVAVATNRVGRPVRCMLDRDEDMSSTGGRNPHLCKYKIGFMKDGSLKSMDIQLYVNAGNSLNTSAVIVQKTKDHIDNVYRISNIRVREYACKTNLPSNTAFRALGGVQGLIFAECWMTDIAIACGISQRQVREVNMYRDHDMTPYNQELYPCHAQQCWNECLEKSDFDLRQKEVLVFNQDNRWKKRGLSIIPTKFGIAYEAMTDKCKHQAGALVHVYTDGSVLLAHGGIEMGQGLHTKMVQVASRELQIGSERIRINETSTSAVPNTTGTTASSGTDFNAGAVKKACEEIMARLKPYMEANPKGNWEDWVRTAYNERVSLSTTGFYRTPDLHYDSAKMCGTLYNYFVYGAACSLVEVDCLTGDHTVLRTDIVIDIGKSLNPAIDMGQIEGAFVQGYGMVTLEDLRWSPRGELLTRGPGMYKIPGCGDIPLQFNVSFLANAENPRAIYSSKGVGEPSLGLAASVFYAIKSAVGAARAEVGLGGCFRMDSPATADRIRMACTDQFTRQFPADDPSSYQPWFLRL